MKIKRDKDHKYPNLLVYTLKLQQLFMQYLNVKINLNQQGLPSPTHQ